MMFFLKQKTAYEMRISDWSSDVCSSDLIPLPREIYRSQGHDRDNSMGINLYNDERLRELAEQVNAAVRSDWRAGPLVPGAKPSTADTVEVTSPADRRQVVGHWQPADAAVIAQAMDNAVAAQPAWDATP